MPQPPNTGACRHQTPSPDLKKGIYILMVLINIPPVHEDLQELPAVLDIEQDPAAMIPSGFDVI